jgi:hypothetical protein
LDELHRKRIERTVAKYVQDRRPPAHIRDQVDLSFRFDGRAVEIFEIRPSWNDPSEKIDEPVAKGRYVQSRDEWLVYWQRADLRWHKYDPAPSVATLEAFLAVVDRDEYGCFFG